MEFLGFLWSSVVRIYDMVDSRFAVRENAPICRKHDIYGWFDSGAGSLTICTNRIKLGSDFKYYINETFLHESVHAAQACKFGGRGMEPFRIARSSMPLTQRRRNDVEAGVRIAGETVRVLEHEAFWMEDKPGQVNYVVKKYCF